MTNQTPDSSPATPSPEPLTLRELLTRMAREGHMDNPVYLLAPNKEGGLSEYTVIGFHATEVYQGFDIMTTQDDG